MTRRLLLHIGHSKTGSSFLQSTLALSAPALREAGLIYPRGDSDARARKGLMTTGNARALREALTSDDATRLPPPPANGDVLYSAEHLTPILAAPGGVPALRRLAVHHGFAEVRLLLVLRDPMEHLLSEYSQKIKGGRTMSLNRLSRTYDYPVQVLKIMQALQGADEMHLTVMNYRRIRDDLTGALAGWLGMAPGGLTTPETGIVNRSLTVDELAFQRELNRHFERSVHVLAEPLLAELQRQPPRPPVLERAATRAFFRRLGPSIRGVNRALPRADRYRTGGPFRLWHPRRLLAGLRGSEIRLTPEQVAVITRGFADEIKRRN